MKRHNFSAGPCVLPQEVMEKLRKQYWILTMAFRLLKFPTEAAFVDIMENARALVLELLDLEGMVTKFCFTRRCKYPIFGSCA